MKRVTLRSPRLFLGTLGMILALAAFLLLGPLGGDEEPVEVPGGTVAAVTATVAPTPDTAPAPPAVDAEVTATRETFQIFSARDPFQQLVVLSQDTGTGAEPGDSETPAPAPGGAPVIPGPGESPAPAVKVGGTTIELVDTYEKDGEVRALVSVNGVGYDVAAGETFAQSVRVLAIDPPCATLLFGDSRFTACEGEQVRK